MIDIPRSTFGRLLPKGRTRKVMQVVNEGLKIVHSSKIID